MTALFVMGLAGAVLIALMFRAALIVVRGLSATDDEDEIQT